MFIFQACYGTPTKYVKVTGTVVAKQTSQPIKGIKVLFEDSYRIDEQDTNIIDDDMYYQYAYTNSDGKFDQMLDARYNNYKIVFTDVDGAENGAFQDKIITIGNIYNSDEHQLYVELDEANGKK
jgi:putative lipoprotein (rSAM/lipoprotein system)